MEWLFYINALLTFICLRSFLICFTIVLCSVFRATHTYGHQPSLQYVHGGQPTSFGGTSVEAVHELLSENPRLHWQPITSLNEFDPIPRDMYLHRPNRIGGMTGRPAQPIGLKIEVSMTSVGIDVETVCPLKTQTFAPGTHEHDPTRHSLIEGVSKCMITRDKAQAKFREYRDAQGPHDEVYTDGSKINERVGAAAVINRLFENGETTCRQLSKILSNNSTIFATEATAITLALIYYRHMDPVQHDVIFYSDSVSCLQTLMALYPIQRFIIPPPNEVGGGVYWIHLVRLSVSLSVDDMVSGA